jgi:hypothetical protein
MPRGTDPVALLRAAREFARIELSDHKYVLVLHDHQANPHVHLSVRAESEHGKRLNPRKADIHRWRETFAEKLRDWGVDAEATRQATRGRSRNYQPLWKIKAREDGRLRTEGSGIRSSARAGVNRAMLPVPPFLLRPDKARAVAVIRHGAGTVGPDFPGLRIDAQEAVGGQ